MNSNFQPDLMDKSDVKAKSKQNGKCCERQKWPKGLVRRLLHIQ